MAIKLITLRAFMTEISGSIMEANQRLRRDGYARTGPQSERAEPQTPAGARPAPLEIKSVRVSFSARVANRKLSNSKPVRQDEVLLDFTGDGRRAANNIYGELIFSGKGETMDVEAWSDGEDEYFLDEATGQAELAARKYEDNERSM